MEEPLRAEDSISDQRQKPNFVTEGLVETALLKFEALGENEAKTQNKSSGLSNKD